MKSDITAICISRNPERWEVREVPFYCYTEGYKAYPHYPPVKTRERVQYLADRRNAAHRQTVALYPNTQHFLCIDSYYLNQTHEIRNLIREYADLESECILGATNWFKDYSRVPLRLRYWDTWATPEMKDKKYDYYPRKDGLPQGWEKVRGCGGFTLYPRWVWEHRGYGVPEPFPHAGNEVNYLCQCPGIQSYVTFNVKALRETPNEIVNRSLSKRLRTTLGIGTRLHLRRDSASKSGGPRY